jgi:hypothetical protein
MYYKSGAAHYAEETAIISDRTSRLIIRSAAEIDPDAPARRSGSEDVVFFGISATVRCEDFCEGSQACKISSQDALPFYICSLTRETICVTGVVY